MEGSLVNAGPSSHSQLSAEPLMIRFTFAEEQSLPKVAPLSRVSPHPRTGQSGRIKLWLPPLTVE